MTSSMVKNTSAVAYRLGNVWSQRKQSRRTKEITSASSINFSTLSLAYCLLTQFNRRRTRSCVVAALAKLSVTNRRRNLISFGGNRGMMEKNNILALAALTVLISGCANMDYRQQAALKGAAAGTILGGGIGGGIAAATDGKNRFAIGGPVGATTGAIVGGLLGYYLAEAPKPPPAPPPPPQPPPPPPPPPPAKPKPPPPPPPPPPPAPKVERTILLDDVLFDFDKST